MRRLVVVFIILTLLPISSHASIGYYTRDKKGRIRYKIHDKDSSYETPKDVAGTREGKKIVYANRVDMKYHKKGCRFLRGTANKMTLEEAIELGYEPCQRCRP